MSLADKFKGDFMYFLKKKIEGKHESSSLYQKQSKIARPTGGKSKYNNPNKFSVV